MNIPEEYIILFESYGRGELSDQEKKDFEARLSYDTDFGEAFARFRLIEKGIQEHYRNELRDNFKEIDKELDSKSPGVINFRKLVWIGTSVAAVLLIGLSVYHNFSHDHKYKELALQYWPEEEGLPVKMSTAGKYDAAMNAYKQSQWAEAEALLTEISSSDTALYFLGIVHFKQENYTEALEHFSRVPEYSRWFPESEFRRALIFMIKNEPDSTSIILNRLMKAQSGCESKAKELLLKI
ncbi:MAG: tetratricopeptide repeat protein [Cryomorphaceae bacterium]|nr:MAG: tetratricopeptide repeat protein [Cryomorphaceae bacterium]